MESAGKPPNFSALFSRGSNWGPVFAEKHAQLTTAYMQDGAEKHGSITSLEVQLERLTQPTALGLLQATASCSTVRHLALYGAEAHRTLDLALALSNVMSAGHLESLELNDLRLDAPGVEALCGALRVVTNIVNLKLCDLATNERDAGFFR